MSKKPPGRWDHVARKAYLDVLRRTGLRATACEAAGISRQTVQKYTQLDPTLSDEIEDALEMYKDSIRAEIRRRAIDGVEEPVYYQGVHVGSIKKYSDRMLELEAKRHMPEYRDSSRVDVNHKGGVLIVPTPQEEPEKWAERANANN